MLTDRRKMIKMMTLSALSISGMNMTKKISPIPHAAAHPSFLQGKTADDLNLIGAYGKAVIAMKGNDLPTFSYRNNKWTDLESWRKAAKERLTEKMCIPPIGNLPAVTIQKQYEYDGLHIEELSWQLPYGALTQAILLKPTAAKGPLPAILAFHDHGGNKYFGARKITKTSDAQHPMMTEHQHQYYGGFAWANEIAKRGYVVLVPDAFTFASRRVMLQDVPMEIRNGLNDNDPENPEHINAYNQWAGQHEHIMAKSLFSAGTTWPGMFFAEDKIALDILCERKDVDTSKIGCGGLSGGGIRTAFTGGLDPRIKCAVCVGFMTTWDDFVLHKSFNHTWMTYVPLLPKELDFPEILALRVPLPALVLNNNEDDLFTLSEMKKAENTMAEVYKKTGMPDHFVCSYYDGVHKFDKAMQSEAFQFFDKWLK
jgi:dienelactone hydrolase